jgi:hypothetical protein
VKQNAQIFTEKKKTAQQRAQGPSSVLAKANQ